MQNSFVRLKYYRPDKADARENHATECIAACLRWSPTFRAAFVRFLFSEGIPPKFQQSDSIEIRTQEPIPDGFLDLILVSENFFAVVEVKVHGNSEDQRQLGKYLDWLKGKSGKLFTLVQTPNPSLNTFFNQKNIGRRIWRDLYEHLKGVDSQLKARNISKDEFENLRDEFCDYLEQEGIVSVHSVIELVDYSKGLSATAALRNIFDRVEQELKARDAEFETKSKWLGTSDTWPKLEIMHPAYERVFGEGSLFRIWVWFAVPGIWKADCHGFCIELQMWNRELKSNWDTTASRLPQWKSKLEQDPAGFVFEAEISSVEWRNYAEGKQLQFSSEPRRVLCYPKSAYDPKPVQDQFSSVDETVRWLVQEIWHVHDCILKL